MAGRHYLDHASTSPLRPEASAAIAAWATEGPFADPGRVYGEGRVVRDLVEQARTAVAELIGAPARQVILTSSGTEAINLACAGIGSTGRHPVLAAPVEHSAVRRASEQNGPVVDLAVDHLGRIDLGQLESLLDVSDDHLPRLVHCQLANHEVGTVQPVAEVTARCHERRVPVHVDACGAVGQIPVAMGELGADLLSLSAHKFGGPPGIGALVLGRGTRVTPLLQGGDQERGRRAGMENVPGIVGLGAVAAVLGEPGVIEAAGLVARERTRRILAAALALDGVVAYGDVEDRLPNLVCLGIEGIEAEGIVLGLDQAGIAVHSGSACSSESLEPSPVLEAMGVAADRSVRISVGWSTDDADIEAFIDAFPAVVGGLRALRT